jgi:hypothetical protein
MDVLFRNGGASHNETVYSDCREFAGETTIRFDDPEPGTKAAPAKESVSPLPARTGLRIGLEKTIDTATAAAGDEVTGVLLEDAKNKAAHKNDRVHGRILRLEQVMGASPHWIVAIRFDAIERSGQTQPVSLRPLNDGPAAQRPPGAGVFIFPGRGDVVIDAKFQSQWETR